MLKEVNRGWKSWDCWVYKKGNITDISEEVKEQVVNWIVNIKRGIQTNTQPGPTAKKLGELREVWYTNGQPIFIHTDPIYDQPESFRIQLVCSPKHMRELKRTGILGSETITS